MRFPERPRYTSGGPPAMNRNPASRRALEDSRAYEATRSMAQALGQLQVTLENLELEMVFEIAGRRHIGGKGPVQLAYEEAIAAGLLRQVDEAPDEVLITGSAEFRILRDSDMRFRPMFTAYVNRYRRERRDALILDLLLIALDLLLAVAPLLRIGRVAAMAAEEARVASWMNRLAGVVERLREIVSGGGRLVEARSAARRLLTARRAAGTRVVVNIGGTGETAGAINLNPNVVAARSTIPEQVPAAAEDLGELFPAGSIDEITSNNLPPNTLDWERVLPGAHRTLKPGGRINIRFRGGQGATDGPMIERQLERLGFREIRNWGDGAAVDAVRGP